MWIDIKNIQLLYNAVLISQKCVLVVPTAISVSSVTAKSSSSSAELTGLASDGRRDSAVLVCLLKKQTG